MQLSKSTNRIISILLAFFAILFILPSFSKLAFAEEEIEYEDWSGIVVRSGYSKGNDLNIRKGAGTSFSSVTQINKNARIFIISEEKDSNDKIWYYSQVLSSGKYGYASSWNIIEDTNLSLKESISIDSKTVKELEVGEKVTVLDRSNKDNKVDGVQWYYVKTEDEKVGYISSNNIMIYYTEDEDFETYLTLQGFPESYKPYLRELHTKYPNWVFTAAHTKVDFNKAVSKEANLSGKTIYKLVTTSMPESYRSTERYRYSLIKGKDYDYVGYVPKKDGGTYYAASNTAIAYYMDPRNWLNSTYIYMFILLSYDEKSQTKEGLQKLLKGTFMEGEFPEDEFETWADCIMEAAKNSGVSPYEIASKIVNEQGNDGQGNSISGTVKGYEGYYNFFNISAAGANAITNGLIYAKNDGKEGSYNRPWNSRYKSILGGALWYGKGYVTAKNPQDTKYFVMWNTNNGLDKIPSHQYATFIKGAATEASIVKKAYNGLTDAPLAFKIPVYLNMPETASPKPPEKGNNIYFLSSLSVEGFTLDEFDPYQDSYELVVNKAVNSVNVNATAFSKDAKIEGLGKVLLGEVGTVTTVKIKVIASAGTEKTYTLKISRAKSGGQKPVIINPPTYSIGKYLTGIYPELKFSDFYNTFEVEEGDTFILLNKNGEEVNSGFIGTGMNVEVRASSGDLKNTYVIKISGDVNGDGKVNSSDVLQIQKHIVGKVTLEGVYLDASDAKRDGAINSSDALLIQKYIVGKEELQQIG